MTRFNDDGFDPSTFGTSGASDTNPTAGQIQREIDAFKQKPIYGVAAAQDGFVRTVNEDGEFDKITYAGYEARRLNNPDFYSTRALSEQMLAPNVTDTKAQMGQPAGEISLLNNQGARAALRTGNRSWLQSIGFDREEADVLAGTFFADEALDAELSRRQKMLLGGSQNMGAGEEATFGQRVGVAAGGKNIIDVAQETLRQKTNYSIEEALQKPELREMYVKILGVGVGDPALAEKALEDEEALTLLENIAEETASPYGIAKDRSFDKAAERWSREANEMGLDFESSARRLFMYQRSKDAAQRAAFTLVNAETLAEKQEALSELSVWADIVGPDAFEALLATQYQAGWDSSEITTVDAAFKTLPESWRETLVENGLSPQSMIESGVLSNVKNSYMFTAQMRRVLLQMTGEQTREMALEKGIHSGLASWTRRVSDTIAVDFLNDPDAVLFTAAGVGVGVGSLLGVGSRVAASAGSQGISRLAGWQFIKPLNAKGVLPSIARAGVAGAAEVGAEGYLVSQTSQLDRFFGGQSSVTIDNSVLLNDTLTYATMGAALGGGMIGLPSGIGLGFRGATKAVSGTANAVENGLARGVLGEGIAKQVRQGQALREATVATEGAYRQAYPNLTPSQAIRLNSGELEAADFVTRAIDGRVVGDKTVVENIVSPGSLTRLGLDVLETVDLVQGTLRAVGPDGKISAEYLSDVIRSFAKQKQAAAKASGQKLVTGRALTPEERTAQYDNALGAAKAEGAKRFVSRRGRKGLSPAEDQELLEMAARVVDGSALTVDEYKRAIELTVRLDDGSRLETMRSLLNTAADERQVLSGARKSFNKEVDAMIAQGKVARKDSFFRKVTAVQSFMGKIQNDRTVQLLSGTGVSMRGLAKYLRRYMDVAGNAESVARLNREFEAEAKLVDLIYENGAKQFETDVAIRQGFSFAAFADSDDFAKIRRLSELRRDLRNRTAAARREIGDQELLSDRLRAEAEEIAEEIKAIEAEMGIDSASSDAYARVLKAQDDLENYGNATDAKRQEIEERGFTKLSDKSDPGAANPGSVARDESFITQLVSGTSMAEKIEILFSNLALWMLPQQRLLRSKYRTVRGVAQFVMGNHVAQKNFRNMQDFPNIQSIVDGQMARTLPVLRENQSVATKYGSRTRALLDKTINKNRQTGKLIDRSPEHGKAVLESAPIELRQRFDQLGGGDAELLDTIYRMNDLYTDLYVSTFELGESQGVFSWRGGGVDPRTYVSHNLEGRMSEADSASFEQAYVDLMRQELLDEDSALDLNILEAMGWIRFVNDGSARTSSGAAKKANKFYAVKGSPLEGWSEEAIDKLVKGGRRGLRQLEEIAEDAELRTNVVTSRMIKPQFAGENQSVLPAASDISRVETGLDRVFEAEVMNGEDVAEGIASIISGQDPVMDDLLRARSELAKLPGEDAAVDLIMIDQAIADRVAQAQIAQQRLLPDSELEADLPRLDMEQSEIARIATDDEAFAALSPGHQRFLLNLDDALAQGIIDENVKRLVMASYVTIPGDKLAQMKFYLATPAERQAAHGFQKTSQTDDMGLAPSQGAAGPIGMEPTSDTMTHLHNLAPSLGFSDSAGQALGLLKSATTVVHEMTHVAFVTAPYRLQQVFQALYEQNLHDGSMFRNLFSELGMNVDYAMSNVHEFTSHLSEVALLMNKVNLRSVTDGVQMTMLMKVKKFLVDLFRNLFYDKKSMGAAAQILGTEKFEAIEKALTALYQRQVDDTLSAEAVQLFSLQPSGMVVDPIAYSRFKPDGQAKFKGTREETVAEINRLVRAASKEKDPRKKAMMMLDARQLSDDIGATQGQYYRQRGEDLVQYARKITETDPGEIQFRPVLTATENRSALMDRLYRDLVAGSDSERAMDAFQIALDQMFLSKQAMSEMKETGWPHVAGKPEAYGDIKARMQKAINRLQSPSRKQNLQETYVTRKLPAGQKRQIKLQKPESMFGAAEDVGGLKAYPLLEERLGMDGLPVDQVDEVKRRLMASLAPTEFIRKLAGDGDGRLYLVKDPKKLMEENSQFREALNREMKELRADRQNRLMVGQGNFSAMSFETEAGDLAPIGILQDALQAGGRTDDAQVRRFLGDSQRGDSMPGLQEMYGEIEDAIAAGLKSKSKNTRLAAKKAEKVLTLIEELQARKYSIERTQKGGVLLPKELIEEIHAAYGGGPGKRGFFSMTELKNVNGKDKGLLNPEMIRELFYGPEGLFNRNLDESRKANAAKRQEFEARSAENARKDYIDNLPAVRNVDAAISVGQPAAPFPGYTKATTEELTKAARQYDSPVEFARAFRQDGLEPTEVGRSIQRHEYKLMDLWQAVRGQEMVDIADTATTPLELTEQVAILNRLSTSMRESGQRFMSLDTQRNMLRDGYPIADIDGMEMTVRDMSSKYRGKTLNGLFRELEQKHAGDPAGLRSALIREYPELFEAFRTPVEDSPTRSVRSLRKMRQQYLSETGAEGSVGSGMSEGLVNASTVDLDEFETIASPETSFRISESSEESQVLLDTLSEDELKQVLSDMSGSDSGLVAIGAEVEQVRSNPTMNNRAVDPKRKRSFAPKLIVADVSRAQIEEAIARKANAESLMEQLGGELPEKAGPILRYFNSTATPAQAARAESLQPVARLRFALNVLRENGMFKMESGLSRQPGESEESLLRFAEYLSDSKEAVDALDPSIQDRLIKIYQSDSEDYASQMMDLLQAEGIDNMGRISAYVEGLFGDDVKLRNLPEGDGALVLVKDLREEMGRRAASQESAPVGKATTKATDTVGTRAAEAEAARVAEEAAAARAADGSGGGDDLPPRTAESAGEEPDPRGRRSAADQAARDATAQAIRRLRKEIDAKLEAGKVMTDDAPAPKLNRDNSILSRGGSLLDAYDQTVKGGVDYLSPAYKQASTMADGSVLSPLEKRARGYLDTQAANIKLAGDTNDNTVLQRQVEIIGRPDPTRNRVFSSERMQSERGQEIAGLFAENTDLLASTMKYMQRTGGALEIQRVLNEVFETSGMTMSQMFELFSKRFAGIKQTESNSGNYRDRLSDADAKEIASATELLRTQYLRTMGVNVDKQDASMGPLNAAARIARNLMFSTLGGVFSLSVGFVEVPIGILRASGLDPLKLVQNTGIVMGALGKSAVLGVSEVPGMQRFMSNFGITKRIQRQTLDDLVLRAESMGTSSMYRFGVSSDDGMMGGDPLFSFVDRFKRHFANVRDAANEDGFGGRLINAVEATSAGAADLTGQLSFMQPLTNAIREVASNQSKGQFLRHAQSLDKLALEMASKDNVSTKELIAMARKAGVPRGTAVYAVESGLLRVHTVGGKQVSTARLLMELNPRLEYGKNNSPGSALDLVEMLKNIEASERNMKESIVGLTHEQEAAELINAQRDAARGLQEFILFNIGRKSPEVRGAHRYTTGNPLVDLLYSLQGYVVGAYTNLVNNGITAKGPLITAGLLSAIAAFEYNNRALQRVLYAKDEKTRRDEAERLTRLWTLQPTQADVVEGLANYGTMSPLFGLMGPYLNDLVNIVGGEFTDLPRDFTKRPLVPPAASIAEKTLAGGAYRLVRSGAGMIAGKDDTWRNDFAKSFTTLTDAFTPVNTPLFKSIDRMIGGNGNLNTTAALTFLGADAAQRKMEPSLSHPATLNLLNYGVLNADEQVDNPRGLPGGPPIVTPAARRITTRPEQAQAAPQAPERMMPQGMQPGGDLGPGSAGSSLADLFGRSNN